VNWFRKFLVKGVFWRRLLRFGVLNAPFWLEPIAMASWSWIFLLWGPGRRGVMRNLSAILPGSWTVTNFFRTYRVFWNFAWTIADNVRFKETKVSPDWEFSGMEHFERLQAESGGAIILTAHMGNYDLGAHLFAGISSRQIVTVRAPEYDPETQRYEEEMHGRTTGESVKVGFSTRSGELALDLLHSVRGGDVIAIQGDRAIPGISTLPTTLFGKRAGVPAGPFALAMTSGVPIYPLFIVRKGRRRYRLVVGEPFHVTRTRNRAEAFERGVARWTGHLESVIAESWYQWFTFEAYSEELV
jgi:phosphatidylinositol dimannoside acyltransferase